jgi:shikimate kinase
MGSGKSTVGRLVADRLDRPFVDSDEQIESETGRTVRQIWEREGEDAFRRLESAALASALSGEEPAVVAAAGGVVLAEENRRLLDGAGTVVWLRGDPALLAQRAARGAHRPLLDGDATGALDRMEAERAKLYADVADAVIDVDGLAPVDVADRVVALAAEVP